MVSRYFFDASYKILRFKLGTKTVSVFLHGISKLSYHAAKYFERQLYLKIIFFIDGFFKMICYLITKTVQKKIAQVNLVFLGIHSVWGKFVWKNS